MAKAEVKRLSFKQIGLWHDRIRAWHREVFDGVAEVVHAGGWPRTSVPKTVYERIQWLEQAMVHAIEEGRTEFNADSPMPVKEAVILILNYPLNARDRIARQRFGGTARAFVDLLAEEAPLAVRGTVPKLDAMDSTFAKASATEEIREHIEFLQRKRKLRIEDGDQEAIDKIDRAIAEDENKLRRVRDR